MLQSAQAAAEPNFMDTLPLDAFDFPQLRAGDTVEGSIVSVSPTQILVDIHYKSDAVVDPRELERLDKDFLDEPSPPATRSSAVVVQSEDRDGNVVISLSRAQQDQDWQQAEELLESQDVFEGVVTGYNRGGVIVRVGRVRGFVPASQLSAAGRASRTPRQILSSDGPGWSARRCSSRSSSSIACATG